MACVRIVLLQLLGGVDFNAEYKKHLCRVSSLVLGLDGYMDPIRDHGYLLLDT